MRIPQSLVNELQEFLIRYGQIAHAAPTFMARPKKMPAPPKHLPFYSNKVAAGFPSPATDHVDTHLDLNEHLIQNPASALFLRPR